MHRTRTRSDPPSLPKLPNRCRLRWAVGLVAVMLLAATGAAAQDTFIGVRVDATRNRVLLAIPVSRLGQDILYLNTLATGAGVSRLGLDRGQLGTNAVVRFERRGSRVLMVRDNWAVRAPGAPPAAVRAAAESFGTSVVASFPIVEDDSGAGTLVVDASTLFLGDAYGVIARLRTAGQGTARVDRDRSWVDETLTGAFPRNTEVRTVITYVGDQPGPELRQAAPEAGALTLQVHHTLMALPDTAGFRPRPADGRSGVNQTSFMDFSQGFDGTFRAAYANRWRLVPRDPRAYLRGELVEPVAPIVYYLDPGIPEPYRTALREGGMWWNQIFQAAGFRNAFQVRDLPAGADPMDARYSMIYWVHRTGPAASVGPSFRDPRTGEILSTVVRLDSYRSLIDYNIYAGLLPAAGDRGLSVSAEEFTMARRRQHGAHEIGHTLGFAHNFIAAAQGRASVMDYPFPDIDVDASGRIDLSDAYRAGGGAWDTLMVRYAYTWFPDEESERVGLQRIIQDGLKAGVRYITGRDAGLDGSVPEALQWLDGTTGFDALERTTRVRRLLVERFDERAVEPGEPLSLLNQRFAHVYLHHRYALQSVVKYVGGMRFTYAVRGDDQLPTEVIPAGDQRRGLTLLLDALEPAALAVPDRVASLIPPASPGTDGSEIWIPSPAGPAFDPVSLAGGLATEVIQNLLNRERAERLVVFSTRDPRNPSLAEVLDTVVARTWGAPPAREARLQVLRRAAQRVVLDGLLDLAGDINATPEVRAVAERQLALLRERVGAAAGGAVEDQAHRAMALRDVDRFFGGEDDPARRSRFPVVPLPWP